MTVPARPLSPACFNSCVRAVTDLSLVGATQVATSSCLNQHARMGHGQVNRPQHRLDRQVSIRAPGWGATRTGRGGPDRRWRFNPRARVGRDTDRAGVTPDLVDVSIHAPAWGATRLMRGFNDSRIVSIHAPAWGATRRRLCAHGQRTVVSIHAPAWGATSNAPICCDCSCVFQSTRPRGARLALRPTRSSTPLFQSTRPRGARPRPSGSASRRRRFNPRARVGRDKPVGRNG